ncbi:TPA: helix-turn-helix transcriptional regulator [Pseudomonas putida]|jgi:transcriptional regulator with XRE-family HTH domain|uniref:helix-turn-helix domain-containing protein n=1 Tax=Pseudomonas putida group TaxID=136845 RepID=UPI0009C18E36|nr:MULTISPECIES: helix-turn-helix transcriptional regulator [Pseudomonas putida group]RNF69060.1 XRE family transcriptional regulator [Pseudomonas putida]
MARISAESDKHGDLLRLGASVRTRRKGLGLSQETLADAAEIDRSHMGKIERGERNVTILNVIKIAEALDIKPSALLELAGL